MMSDDTDTARQEPAERMEMAGAAPASSIAAAGDGENAASRLVEAVEQWFRDLFHGSPIATVTEHYNYAFEAKEELKRRLSELL